MFTRTLPPHARRRSTLAFFALAALGTSLTGCGWTPRDDFYDRRALSHPSQPGDGSQMVFSGDQRTTWPVASTGPMLSQAAELDR